MAETIDQQFIEYIVKALVGNPDKVKVERKIDERGVLLELYVDAEDLGRVIGRNGATAKSIRTLLRALGVKNDARYNLKIVDTNGGPRPVRTDDQAGGPAMEPTVPGDIAATTEDTPISEATAVHAAADTASSDVTPTDTTASEPATTGNQPAADTDQYAATTDAPAGDSTNPFSGLSSEPTEPKAEPETESESGVDRHRKEIDDLTGGLDI